MKKDKLYLFTFVAIFSVVYIVGYFSTNHMVNLSTKQFLKIQLASSKREAQEIASLVSFKIENGVAKHVIIDNIQKSIENTDLQTGFVCMYNKYGKEICHPNPDKIGIIARPNESFVSEIQNAINTEDFHTLLNEQKAGGGIRDFKNSDRASEIIYLFPVENSDWVIAAHANLEKINKEVQILKTNFTLVYLITGTLIALLLFILVRYIGSNYEKHLEVKNEKLTDEVLHLSKLNTDLTNYKNKLNEDKKTNKSRILTHYRNELVAVAIKEIAYIFMQNGTTYIKTHKGTNCIPNESLDEIFKNLDNRLFFRANRQYILSINAIDKIYKYGNKQLKIIVTPIAETDIIISKHKAGTFKAWLNS